MIWIRCPKSNSQLVVNIKPIRFLLEEKGQTETVYMAVSHQVYRRGFHGEAVQVLVKRFEIRLLVVDIEKEEIRLGAK